MQSLSHHIKAAACVISISINVPAVTYTMAGGQSCTPKQIDLTSVFVTTAALLCQYVIVNKWL